VEPWADPILKWLGEVGLGTICSLCVSKLLTM